MAKTFYVRTHSMTYYDNLIRVDEEDMKEYQDECPDLTEEEIVKEMFADGTCEVIDVMPVDWDNEIVDTVQKCNDTEDEENV
jgi:pyoverdine/dityrosine biosynthesis protein Dit1